MKIIAGRLGGRRLLSVTDLSVRPPSGKLRECYFDIVGAQVHGARFLDVCSGTGSMGIEAFSRGAGQVTFVEKSARALAVLRKNLALCGPAAACRILGGDLFRELPRLRQSGAQFDLIYFDPPYFEDLYDRALRLISAERLLDPGGSLATHHFKKTELPGQAGELHRFRVVAHGDARLSFYGWGDGQSG